MQCRLPHRFIAVLLFLALPLPAAAAPADAVKESFLSYQAALLNSNGERAASAVTEGSRDLYREYADQALTLDRESLNSLHIADRLTVMLLRHSVDKQQLQEMSGGEVIAHAIDEGWISKEGTGAIRLDHYEVNGDFATGTVLRPDGSATPFKLQFRKESGAWRLDLREMLKLTRIGIEMTVQQTGMPEDDFILYLLEYSTGRKPGPEIWNPPL